MTDAILTKLLELAPQLGLLVLFIISLFLLLREYRSLRKEIDLTVNEAIDSRLGSLLGKLQLESSRASQIMAEITSEHKETQRLSTEFQERLEEKTLLFNQMLNDIEQKLNQLKQALPTGKNIKYPARQLAVLARNATTVGEAIALIEEVAKDPDATSKDVEVCGDTARRQGKYTLAKEMYELALQRDPENISAKAELLGLVAEIDPKSRGIVIREATDLVLNTMNYLFLLRIANAFIQLDRYVELEELCKKVLERTPESDKSELRSRALRNLAVAEKEQGRLDEARAHLQIAYQMNDKDEDIIRAYTGLLLQIGENDQALELSKKLIILDPLDPTYYQMLANAYSRIGDFDNACVWADKRLLLLPEGPDKAAAQREAAKLALQKEFREQFSQEGPAQGAGNGGEAPKLA
ncbi:MAG: tetratricopeptide repeat protein [Pseudomonadota bacterium]